MSYRTITKLIFLSNHVFQDHSNVHWAWYLYGCLWEWVLHLGWGTLGLGKVTSDLDLVITNCVGSSIISATSCLVDFITYRNGLEMHTATSGLLQLSFTVLSEGLGSWASGSGTESLVLSGPSLSISLGLKNFIYFL